LTQIASGLLAVPISTTPGEYLVWLRPERVRTVTWGGNPFKPIAPSDDPKTLSPRRSFAQWHQLVEATSDAWNEADLGAARLIGDSVSDVIMQFRAVRMLFAQDQLDQVRKQVQLAHQAVVIADIEGRILKMNAAFTALLPRLVRAPQKISDLVPLIIDPADAQGRIQDLLLHRRAWHGEVSMSGPGNAPTPLLVRADPVFTSPERTLGFVLLFTDLTERKAAETARRRFQEGVLTKIVENAQLTALEITDRVDTVRMPEMLEAVRASVARTAEVLRYLVWHATRWAKDRKGPGREENTADD
jgi:PAS domain-containing protein